MSLPSDTRSGQVTSHSVALKGKLCAKKIRTPDSSLELRGRYRPAVGTKLCIWGKIIFNVAILNSLHHSRMSFTCTR